MSHLGARLAHVREVRGLSQTDVALRTGVKVQNISRLEKGRRVHVRSDTLLRLADALQCSTDYLLGRCDDPRPPRTRPRRRTPAPVG